MRTYDDICHPGEEDTFHLRGGRKEAVIEESKEPDSDEIEGE